MPSLESVRSLAKAGIRWHFSGHMHVAGTVELDGLTNFAVPSPVAFPGGYVVVEVQEGEPLIEHVPLADVAGFDIAFTAYRQQFSEADGLFQTAVSATTYGDFLQAHLHGLVHKRHLPAVWPAELRDDCLSWTIEQVLGERADIVAILSKFPSIADMPFRRMMEDYYFLRAAGSAMRGNIPAERACFYQELKKIADNETGKILRSAECTDFLRLLVACV